MSDKSDKNISLRISLWSKNINGVDLNGQIKSLDYKSGNVKFCDKIDDKTYEEIAEIVDLFIKDRLFCDPTYTTIKF